MLKELEEGVLRDVNAGELEKKIKHSRRKARVSRVVTYVAEWGTLVLAGLVVREGFVQDFTPLPMFIYLAAGGATAFTAFTSRDMYRSNSGDVEDYEMKLNDLLNPF